MKYALRVGGADIAVAGLARMDTVALTAIRALTGRGLSVDVKVTSYDDLL